MLRSCIINYSFKLYLKKIFCNDRYNYFYNFFYGFEILIIVFSCVIWIYNKGYKFNIGREIIS